MITTGILIWPETITCHASIIFTIWSIIINIAGADSLRVATLRVAVRIAGALVVANTCLIEIYSTTLRYEFTVVTPIALIAVAVVLGSTGPPIAAGAGAG